MTDEKLNNYAALRMTKTERRLLELIARQEERNLSDTIRKLIRTNAQSRGLASPKRPEAET